MFEFGLSICRCPAETSRNKKHVAGPPPAAKGGNYISAGAPTGVKKAKDA